MAPIDELRDAVRCVHVADPVRTYIVDMARTTRAHGSIELGASPRGTLFLYRASQSFAALSGREYVIPDDVKAVAPSVLAHRLMVDPAFRLRGSSADDVIVELLETVPVPVEE
jgi:MoxR-like ATPase